MEFVVGLFLEFDGAGLVYYQIPNKTLKISQKNCKKYQPILPYFFSRQFGKFYRQPKVLQIW